MPNVETKEIPTNSWVHDVVKNLSQKAGINPPIIRVFDSDEVEVFLTRSLSSHDFRIAISSTGLANPKYILGGIAHEIGHIANKDNKGYWGRFLTIISPNWLFALLMLFPFLYINRVQTGVWLYGHILVLYGLGIPLYFLLAYLSRKMEYKADLKGCSLLGNSTPEIKWFEYAKSINYGYSELERFFLIRVLKNCLVRSPTHDSRIARLKKLVPSPE